MSAIISIDYVNHKGERAWRQVIPLAIRFGSSPWHEAEQWFLEAVDAEKGEQRTFALLAIHGLAGPGRPRGRSDSEARLLGRVRHLEEVLEEIRRIAADRPGPSLLLADIEATASKGLRLPLAPGSSAVPRDETIRRLDIWHTDHGEVVVCGVTVETPGILSEVAFLHLPDGDEGHDLPVVQSTDESTFRVWFRPGPRPSQIQRAPAT